MEKTSKDKDKKVKKYQREWEENKKTLKNNPELLELLSELNDAKLLKTQSTTRYNSLRGKNW